VLEFGNRIARRLLPRAVDDLRAGGEAAVALAEARALNELLVGDGVVVEHAQAEARVGQQVAVVGVRSHGAGVEGEPQQGG
jgi:hypothetical protein